MPTRKSNWAPLYSALSQWAQEQEMATIDENRCLPCPSELKWVLSGHSVIMRASQDSCRAGGEVSLAETATEDPSRSLLLL